MTNDAATKKSALRGTPTLQAALLLFVVGVIIAIAGAGALGGLFILGAVATVIVGLIQRENSARALEKE